MPGTWTYDPAKVATIQMDEVRLLCGDTDSTRPLLFNEEILFFIAEFGDSYTAATQACYAIAAKLAKEADQKTGQIAVWLTKRVQWYLELAKKLRMQANLSAASPYAGGISAEDKASQEADTDRVAPAFNIGMNDNT